MKNIQELFERGKDLLKDQADAGVEARILLCKCASISVETFHADGDRKLTRGQERKFLRLVSKRLSGVPLSYLTNEREFWSLSFAVYPGVLIPRPESELIVEKVVELSSGHHKLNPDANKSALKTQALPVDAHKRSSAKSKQSSVKPGQFSKMEKQSSDTNGTNERLTDIGYAVIADIGTGSGNIAISLARELPEAQIVASDTSRTALKVARMNAQNLGVSNVTVAQGSLFVPLDRFKLRRKCDFIVSNPPYVARKDWETLQPEVRDFEPKRALVAGKTGLEFIQKLVKGAPKYLKPGGCLVFEIGYGQREDVLSLFGEGDNWTSVLGFDDLSGIPRVVVACL
ncbi:MAG: HemK/PrmC family methyltransferase [Candidatus Aminicenantaceae bacterium]